MKQWFLVVWSVFLSAAVQAVRLDAAVVLAPRAVSTDMGNEGSVINLIDQSGISPGYTSLVTDFGAFIADNPQHSVLTGGSWSATVGSGILDFDLGGTYLIEALAVWNGGTTESTSMGRFQLYLDDNPSFTSPVSHSLSMDRNNDHGSHKSVDVFTFPPVLASHARMLFQGPNQGGTGFVDSSGVNNIVCAEVAFAAVPEPEGALFSGLAVLAFAAMRRRFT